MSLTYELPEGTPYQDFQLFEVKGKNSNDGDFPHKPDRPHRHNYYEICVFIHVKKITGYTAGEIILHRLILQATRLLFYTDLSNNEIAFQLNYKDPFYFTRVFKKKTR